MLSLLLAALLSSNASGKTLVRTQPGTTVPISGSGVIASFPFSAPGCYASGSAVGTKGETITITRATVATYATAAGTIATCQANEARIGCDPTSLSVCGLLFEPARTNYALNAATHPKTGESTGALSTGAHVAWHTGTGTMTLAAGTATVTGLTCTTVAAGTLCTFTVTGAGTMAITTTAGTTHAQVENGSYRTSQIATAGAAVARNADSISIANPLVTSNPATWCISGTYTPAFGRAWTVETGGLWNAGAPGAANTAGLWATNSGTAVFRVYDAASGQRTATTGAHGFAAGTSQRVAGAISADVAAYLNGVPSGTSAGAGTGTIATMPTLLYFGLAPGTVTSPTFVGGFAVRKGSCR